MKYKIKVEVKGNGDSVFYPMVKRYWWSPWMYMGYVHYRPITADIYDIDLTLFKEDYLGFYCIDAAKERINEYHKCLLEKTVDRTYEIPYKIE